MQWAAITEKETRLICVILMHAISALNLGKQDGVSKVRPKIKIWPPCICFLIKQAVATSQSARYFKNSPTLSNLTLFPCFRSLIKLQRRMTNPCGSSPGFLESHPGNPLLRLSYFWEIRANLKLFNRVYIFPPNQSCQPLVKNKNVSGDHQRLW